ncbi:MAG: hypothetical protein JXR19_11695 [Bacteroidia bacterium]
MATIVGGVVYFFLGWLVYGMMLMDYMGANSNTCAMRGEDEFVWWAMIASNLLFALLLAIIFSWSGVSSAMKGLTSGAIIGLLFALTMAMGQYAMTTMYGDLTIMVVDVLASTVMAAVLGGVVAWVLNMGKG